MNKKSQYYALIEINNGEVILHKESRPYSGIDNPNEVYNKKILDSALRGKVTLIGFVSEIDEAEDVRLLFLGVKNIGLFISLVVSFCNQEPIAVDGPIPNRNGEIRFSDCRKDCQRNETLASYWAIYHYLVNNTDSYLINVKRINTLLYEFYNTYMSTNRISVFTRMISVFNRMKEPSLFDDREINDTLIIGAVHSEIISFVNDCIQQNNESEPIFLFGIGGLRQIDIYENYGLGLYEAGEECYDYLEDCHIREYPSSEEIMNKWGEQEESWNEKYINLLKSLSINQSKTFFLRIRQDYPFDDENIKFNPV